jgi:hypothetical protein
MAQSGPQNPRGYLADVITAVISTAADGLSDQINLRGLVPVGLQLPSSWTDAGVTFRVSYDGSTNYASLHHSTGTEYTISATEGRYYALTPSAFYGAQKLQVRSGTHASVVAQGSSRAIGLVLRYPTEF